MIRRRRAYDNIYMIEDYQRNEERKRYRDVERMIAKEEPTYSNKPSMDANRSNRMG